MLAKFFCPNGSKNKIILTKECDREDASLFGAFSLDKKLTIALTIPRALGITYPTMRINKDGQPHNEYTMSYSETVLGCDRFEIKLDLQKLCENEPSGLFYYDFTFPIGNRLFFSDTCDNVNMELSETEGAKFRLLIYEKDFATPHWFKGGTMYHIFVDRFNKGSFNVPLREDAEINDDWENGIPQYGEYPGAFVKNNMFFGGNLFGIEEKLPYLQELGVTVLYLSPIFKAYSNHKYDTGDYMQVDEMFGGEVALKSLIEKCKKRGIRIILDGVFNHTGDDSIYFNKYGKYTSVGAYQSKNSPYYSWYHFKDHPDEYASWWGISILPKLNLENDECKNYFVGEKNSVIEKYTKMGIGGIRLDVADELTDDFLDKLRSTAKNHSNNDAVIIGEVWENAADKIAYGKRRRYLQGAQLDSVMNYPFRSATIDYLMSGDSSLLASALTELYASYPKCVCDSLMNILGTHDTDRIITSLSGEDYSELSNAQLAHYKMSEKAMEKAIKLLKLGSVLQYTVYGVPSVFYGDEAGLEGCRDPFCRRPFPWGKENKELLSHYKRLGKIRQENGLLSDGIFKITQSKNAYIEFERGQGKNKLTIAVNAGDTPIFTPICGEDLLSGNNFSEDSPLQPYSAVILKQPAKLLKNT